MAPKQSSTHLSPSGRVEYAVTNYVALLDKESVHQEFHSLVDFLKNSPVSYALTASPTIYAEIVEEMWSTACCSQGVINLKIKGNSYIITPCVINEALHLPNSNFENLPTDEEILAMLKSIKYASKRRNLSDISLSSMLRKEWSYFFDTLSKVFTSRCGNYIQVTKFVLIIGYSLMYNRTIDIGSLLLQKFSTKLGNVGDKSKVIYYARFLMIIANHLCKELSTPIKDRDDTLQVFVQTVTSFWFLLDKNLNAKVKFVLPDHIRTQLSTLSPWPVHDTMGKGPIPSTKVTLPSHSLSGKEATTLVSGKRKNFAGTIEGINKEATEINPAKKKTEASIVKPQTGLSDVDPQLPPGFSRDGVPVKLEPNSPEEDIPQDRQELVKQHLVNTASLIKSQLVACLTSCADKLRADDMINLANRSYSALTTFGDDYTSFSREVDKLIAHRRTLEYAVENKKNFYRDIKARHIQQQMSLSDVWSKSSGAQEKLSRAETYVESLKLKKEELTGALFKLTEELSEEEKRVKALAAERDQCTKSYSDVLAKLRKLDAQKEEVRVTFEAINYEYNAAKDEFERMNSQLLQLVRKC